MHLLSTMLLVWAGLSAGSLLAAALLIALEMRTPLEVFRAIKASAPVQGRARSGGTPSLSTYCTPRLSPCEELTRT
jgi:hypothetical protein